jgi:nucleotide-binding universal stress UspA family protein
MNLKSVLCPVDFSEQSRHALRWAAAFAVRFHSTLRVVNVVLPLLEEAARIRLGRDLAETDTHAALREFVAATLPDEVDVRTFVGDPATAILQTAQAEGDDLIVMGTQGLGGIRKLLLGSTTERVLRRTHVPVLAVPLPDESPAAAPGRVSRVVAATDFSESSTAAAAIAADLTREFGATLTLAHIVEPLSVPAQWQELLDESDTARLETARTKLKTLAERICAPQNCDEVIAMGRPELIGTVAEERRTELIVMGLASERGPFAPRPGSIAYRVLASTRIPVLVVPAADQ